MKVGDLVRIKTGSGVFEDGEDTTCYWPESKGQIALLIAKTSRGLDSFPTAKVLVRGEVVEFDIEELEIV
jgi:hypothetical protein